MMLRLVSLSSLLLLFAEHGAVATLPSQRRILRNNDASTADVVAETSNLQAAQVTKRLSHTRILKGSKSKTKSPASKSKSKGPSKAGPKKTKSPGAGGPKKGGSKVSSTGMMTTSSMEGDASSSKVRDDNGLVFSAALQQARAQQSGASSMLASTTTGLAVLFLSVIFAVVAEV